MSDKEKKLIIIYNKELLDLCIEKDNAILIGDYSNLGKYGSGGKRAAITYICKCGNTHTKAFDLIKKSGALCKKCMHTKVCKVLDAGRTKENRDKACFTTGDPNREDSPYNRKSLDDYMIRDKATLIDGDYSILVYNTNIKFICNCENESELPFYDIAGRTKELRDKGYCGALCKSCNLKRWTDARNTTNLKVHGKLGGINITDESRQKGINTCMEKYDVPSANMAESVKQKKIDTNLKIRGVENPAQSQEVMEKIQKNAKKYKVYKMPSGDIRKVQGYEPFALNELVKLYSEEQIKTDRKDVPRVQYEVDKKKKYHFPDIFIPHENKIIEVKSIWTYKCKADNIQLKKEACEKQGFRYEIWCFNPKGKRVDLPIC
jgi:hypothetical protein